MGLHGLGACYMFFRRHAHAWPHCADTDMCVDLMIMQEVHRMSTTTHAPAVAHSPGPSSTTRPKVARQTEGRPQETCMTS